MDLLGIVARKVLLLITPFLTSLALTILFAPELTFLSFLILAAGLYALLKDMAEKIEFMCPKCGRTFRTSITAFFFSPHLTYYKLLKCPECSKVSWCIAKYYDGVELKAMKRFEDKEISPKSLYIQLAVIASCYVIFLASWSLIKAKNSFLLVSSTLIFILFLSLIGYAIRQGYRSQIYYTLTFFGVFVMLLFLFLQIVVGLTK